MVALTQKRYDMALTIKDALHHSATAISFGFKRRQKK